MATRFCLSHAWPGPRCLLLSPWEQKGNVGAWEAPALPGKPWGPAGVLGEAQGGPDVSPQALPDPAQHRNGPGSIPSTQSWAQPLLPPGLLLPAVQPWHCQPWGSSSSPLLLLELPQLRWVCVTPQAQPALQRGSKPYSTTARHPAQAWRGWGQRGVHVINIKSATKKRHILYIFDPYTQEHNIHRTPRRSGDLVRRFLRDVAPLPAPPLCLPHSCVGPYSQNISHQEWHQAGTVTAGVWMERSAPPCLPWGEVG